MTESAVAIPAAALPIAAQKDLQQWRAQMRAIARAGGDGRRDGRQGEAVAFAAGLFGVSNQTIYRRYYAWKEHGDHALLDRRQVRALRKASESDIEQRPAFVQFFRALCEREGKPSCRQAYRKLLMLWRAGNDIPGYDTPPPAGPKGYPAGWSYKNLMRFAPTAYELTGARIGRQAARAHRRQVWSTRVGLEVGQVYVFDDVEHDVNVNLLGVNSRAMRPLELTCLDLFSACRIAYGLKPMMIDDDGHKRKLCARDMRFLLAYILTRVGYRGQGCTLRVEHGTAAIPGDLEQYLFDETGGAIRVERSGIANSDLPMLPGWYRGRRRGNPQFKAALESAHNLIHKATGSLPGQIGSNSRLDKPEPLAGAEKENIELIKAIAALPAERVAELRFPFVEFNKFSEIYHHIVRYINCRYEHDLEGWERAGLLAQEFRVSQDSPQWYPAAALDRMKPDERSRMELMLTSRPALVRVRKLSPHEVWESGRRRLARLHDSAIPMILGPELAVQRKLTSQHIFQFQDRDLVANGDKLRYPAVARNPIGQDVILARARSYMTWVNPFEPDRMHVAEEDGAYIGVCRRIVPAPVDDPEAIHRAMGETAHEEVRLSTEYRLRHAAEAEQRIADIEHNRRILQDPDNRFDAAPDLQRDAIRVDAADRNAALTPLTENRNEDEPQFSEEYITNLLRD